MNWIVRGFVAILPMVLCAVLAPAAWSQTATNVPGYTVTGATRTDAKPPEDASLTVDQAGQIASTDEEVREEADTYGALQFRTGFIEPDAWIVDFRPVQADGTIEERVVAQVLVDDPTGTIREAWTGHQVAWQMARGYPGAFGHALNAPYIWLPLAAIFLLGLLDWRRPFRIAHLDLLVLLSFGISNHFLTRAEIGVSVPLVYPPLIYLLARMLWIGFRGRGDGLDDRPRALRPSAPIAALAIATVLLLGARVALNATSDHSVIDVGYAGVIGADHLAEGKEVWDAFPVDNVFGDTYGPANYLAYVPFEAAFPWSGEWDNLPAARVAAGFFDLATVVGLFVLGGRLRRGREGRALGVIMAFAWAAYPYTAYAFQSNSNDSLIAALLVWSFVFFAKPAVRGGLLALAAMAKFAPLALAPLFAGGERGLGEAFERRSPLSAGRLRLLRDFSLAFVGVCVLMLAVPATDTGLATFWDRTLEMQIDRESPFSIWGQVESLGWLQTLLQAGTIGLAVLVGFVPRRRSLPQLMALGAAVMIAVQIVTEHWFYLYIPWFLPLLLGALVAWDRISQSPEPARVRPATLPPS